MEAFIAWLLFFVKLLLAMIIVGVPLFLIILLIAKYAYDRFLKSTSDDDKIKKA